MIVLKGDNKNRLLYHQFLTSAPFLLDLLHFTDVLFFFLLDFKDVWQTPSESENILFCMHPVVYEEFVDLNMALQWSFL